MAIYVDDLVTWGGDNAPYCFRNKPSCHMYADDLEELHKMAIKIGLKKEWFQNHPHLKHYDLTPSKRELAIKHGAISHDRREAVTKWEELRKKNT